MILLPRVSCASFAALLVICHSIQAQEASPTYFNYFPGDAGGASVMHLGKGFWQKDLTKITPEDCLDFTVGTGAGGEGADAISLDVSVVTQYRALLDKMGIDAEISAHTITSSVDARFRQERQNVENSRNVTIVVTASAEYPQVVTVNPTLKPQYAELLIGQVDEFIERCGTRYPAIERRGVSLQAIITINEASEDLRQVMTASASGSYGSGPVGASASAAFNKEISSAKASNHYDVSVRARGGLAATVFETLIKSAVREKPDIATIGAALAQFAATLTRENAVTLGYFVADMPGLASAIKDPWSSEKQRRLAAIGQDYRKVFDKFAVVQAVLNHTDPRGTALLIGGGEAKFREMDTILAAALASIATVHANCKNEIPPNLTACSSLPAGRDAALSAQTPEPLRVPTGSFRIATRTADGALRWTTELQTKSVLRSPAASTDNDHVDFFAQQFAFGSAPSAPPPPSANPFINYLHRLHRRTQTVMGDDVIDVALVYVIDAPDLESVELYTAVAESTSSKFPAGYAAKRVSAGSLGPSILSVSNEFRPWVAMGQVLGPAFHGFVQHGFAVEGPSAFAGLRPANPLGAMIAAVSRWVTEAKVQTGEGSVNYKVQDMFAGGATLQLIKFDWDWDSVSTGIVRIRYQFETGEPGDEGYIAGPVSIESPAEYFIPYPTLLRASHMFPNASLQQQQVWIERPFDKWGVFKLKSCDIVWRLRNLPAGEPTPGSFTVTRVPKADRPSDFFLDVTRTIVRPQRLDYIAAWAIDSVKSGSSRHDPAWDSSRDGCIVDLSTMTP